MAEQCELYKLILRPSFYSDSSWSRALPQHIERCVRVAGKYASVNNNARLGSLCSSNAYTRLKTWIVREGLASMFLRTFDPLLKPIPNALDTRLQSTSRSLAPSSIVCRSSAMPASRREPTCHEPTSRDRITTSLPQRKGRLAGHIVDLRRKFDSILQR